MVVLDVPYTKLDDYIREYYKSLPESIAKSNTDPEEVFAKNEQGYDRHYMKILSKADLASGVSKQIGLVCFHYDHTYPGGHRCFIRHLSTVKPEDMEEAVGSVVSYIWDHVQCDSIRIEAYQIKDESGSYKPDPLIK